MKTFDFDQDTIVKVVAQYQYWENYAIDEDGVVNTETPYWKAKGGHDEVLDRDFTIAEVCAEGFMDSIKEFGKDQDNGACKLDLLDVDLVYLNRELIERVWEAIEPSDSSKYSATEYEGISVFGIGYDTGLPEKIVRWALNWLTDNGHLVAPVNPTHYNARWEKAS